jgi:phenylpropionate dioxygenase-like ring-hydroxylating dioxygenase large terminal subunit
VRFLKRVWYAAAWAAEVTEQLCARTIAGEPLLFTRDEDGTPRALADLCPHRFAPLSAGRRTGERIRCAYHGLEFDLGGRCVHNPHGSGARPAAARVRSYVVVEHQGIVWLWLGDAEHADPACIPNFDFLEDPRWLTVSGKIHGSGHYELFTDNLMDLGHTEFLHPGLGAAVFTLGKREVSRDGDTVWSNVSHPNTVISQTMGHVFGTLGENFDQWFDMRWNAPASMLLTGYWSRPGTSKGAGFVTPALHIVTPETETTSHYFWAAGRDVRKDDDNLTEQMRTGLIRAFEDEDKPMIALQQQHLGGRDLLAMQPVLLPGDLGAVLARRTLAELMARESLQPLPAVKADASRQPIHE